MRIGLFVGSFDPYTIGHDSIVKRALPLFDKIVIGVGFNERKKYMQTTETRVANIISIYAGEPKIEVKQYNDLTVDFARREGAEFIIKGVSSVEDFEYEREREISTDSLQVSRLFCSLLRQEWRVSAQA